MEHIDRSIEDDHSAYEPESPSSQGHHPSEEAGRPACWPSEPPARPEETWRS